MARVIAVFVDALSDTYLSPETTPTLWRWKEAGGMSSLDPLFAFKGVATSMFTGFPPSETGIWADFRIRRDIAGDASPDRFHRLCHRLPEGLPASLGVTVYERALKGAHVTAHRIPPHVRAHLRAAVGRSTGSASDVGGKPTVFKLLEQAGGSSLTFGLDGGPQGLLHHLLPRAHRLPADLPLVKISSLDGLGHRYGPGSPEVRRALHRIDGLIGRLVSARGDAELVVFSDHGMTAVTDSVDVQGLVREGVPDLRVGRDYVPFYNSTCAMFRWAGPDARDAVLDVLGREPRLTVLDKAALSTLDVDGILPTYADDVVATARGTVIAPDFYRQTPPEGMHGFADLDGERAVVLCPDRPLRDDGKMWDLAPTLLDLAGVEDGHGMAGRSLIA